MKVQNYKIGASKGMGRDVLHAAPGLTCIMERMLLSAGVDEETLVEEAVDIAEAVADGWQIVIFNDDHNTFDHVIECLMAYCGHEVLQAEQCALIVHTRGKCSVKNGDFDELEPICTALLERDLTAEVQPA